MSLKALLEKRAEIAAKVKELAERFNANGKAWANPEDAGNWEQLNKDFDAADAEVKAERKKDEEAQAVAERTGIQFKIGIDKCIAGAQAVGDHKTSMLQDIEHGKALELDALLGSVIELGQVVGLPTPTLQTVHNLCLLLEQSVLRSGRGLTLNSKE